MSFTIEHLRNFLKQKSQPQYQQFSQKLSPQETNILGVRIPELHRYVDTWVKQPLDITVFSMFTNESFEETMVEGLLIGKGPWTTGQRLMLIENYLPKITGWSLCDTFCKFIKDVDQKYWPLIRQCAQSNQEFYQRFALVMLLEHFNQRQYVDEILVIVSNIRPVGYYSQMAIAWLLSMMYVKEPQSITVFLNNQNLDFWTHNKTIQKIIESKQVSIGKKQQLRKLKR